MPKPITVHVHYPPTAATIALRTARDWDRDLIPDRVDRKSTRHSFDLLIDESSLYVKPIRLDGTRRHWSVGENYRVSPQAGRDVDIYPAFDSDGTCSVCEQHHLTDQDGLAHHFRVFLPPGYVENTLRRYPVLYMHDGPNLFFQSEAFGGSHWRIAETLDVLQSMNLVDPMIVVGIYPNARETEYTRPGYEAYGRFLVEVLKPAVDREYRTLTDSGATAVMGSSLGGVVSFYLAWEWPEVFGMAACMSSTFGWRDDLFERVAKEPRRHARLYLDSGWPGDNFEATRLMYDLLRAQGYRDGADLSYLAFPEGAHNEISWAMRAHLPLQFFFRDTGRRPGAPVSRPRRRR
ncbi:MAG: alpha/beta hydrolase-fold protein [Vicinamibacterales bacterium]